MQTLLDPAMVSYSADHLMNFAVMAELRMHAVELLSNLARCERSKEGDEDSDQGTLRSTIAVCTLLKGHSVKVLGLQLLLSFMLIAWATSKQCECGHMTHPPESPPQTIWYTTKQLYCSAYMRSYT